MGGGWGHDSQRKRGAPVPPAMSAPLPVAGRGLGRQPHPEKPPESPTFPREGIDYEDSHTGHRGLPTAGSRADVCLLPEPGAWKGACSAAEHEVLCCRPRAHLRRSSVTGPWLPWSGHQRLKQEGRAAGTAPSCTSPYPEQGLPRARGTSFCLEPVLSAWHRLAAPGTTSGRGDSVMEAGAPGFAS